MRKFLDRWQELIIWAPIAAALLLAATILIPRFDPHAGVDGLGFLQGYAVLLLKGVAIVFMAWLCKRTYTVDMTDEQDRVLLDFALEGRWIALAIDRAEWAMWLLLWYAVMSG